MKLIKIEEKDKANIFNKFKNFINTEKFTDSKLKFELDFNDLIDLPTNITAKVFFTPLAYTKILKLTSKADKEIGFHGIVERIQDSQMYLIKDIILYPQQVTSVTVETDDKEYGEWLHKKLDIETLKACRFHGHSHVNMGVTPSGTDLNWYNEILQGLKNNDYYIFFIINKSNNMFINIYDLKNNIILEKDDITIDVLLEGDTLTNWITTNIETYVKEEVSRVYLAQPVLDDLYPNYNYNIDEIKNYNKRLQNLTKNNYKKKGNNYGYNKT